MGHKPPIVMGSVLAVGGGALPGAQSPPQPLGKSGHSEPEPVSLPVHWGSGATRMGCLEDGVI